jgi:TPR repeat protein
MTVWRPRLAALFISIAACVAQAADSKITIDDLTQRATTGDRTAMHALAESYYAGTNGADQDFAKAADWYLRLAKAGDPRAQTSLGLMYARGYGVTKNLAEAQRWWNFAAIQNDPGAQFNLGLTYATGQGAAVDHERAARWYREAARRGHVQAQHNLGMLYHDGKGVPKDPRQAYYWVRVAALQGDAVAADALDGLRAGMSSAQIAEAESQAAAWMRQARKATQ